MTSVEDDDDVVGVPSDMFFDSCYVHHDFEFGDVRQGVDALKAASTDIDLTGQIVWPGATFLAWYLVGIRSKLAGQRILEVGAGTGLCGLLCSQFASEVLLTDGIAEIVTLLEANIPKYASPSCPLVTAQQFDWGEENASRLQAAHLPPFKIIIGADVLYPFFEGAIALLFQSLKVLLPPDGVFLTGIVLRRPGIEGEALDAARSVGLLVQEADRSYLPSPLPDLLGRVLAVHNVKVLVFGWSEEAMAPWAQAARPPTSA